MKIERPPSRSGSSSSRSTPSLKSKDVRYHYLFLKAFFLFKNQYRNFFIFFQEKPLTPGSKPRSTTPNLNAGPASSSAKVALNQYPPYAIGGARAPEHLNAYNSISQSPYGRPPLVSYEGHPHTRAPGIATNGLGNIPGGKP